MKTRQLVFINNLLQVPGISNLIEKELRPHFNLVQEQIKNDIKDYNYKRVSVYLLNEGIEKENPDGSKEVDYPPFPLRKETTGSDAKYREALDIVIDQRKVIDLKMKDLLDSPVDVKISRFLTNEQFDSLSEAFNVLEFESLREVLVISQPSAAPKDSK